VAELRVVPVPGLPEVRTGDDLAVLVATACADAGIAVEAGDVVAVSSKVVSKAAGLWATDRGAAVRDSTRRVVAERATWEHVTRVVESVAGPVMAAAGVDASNTGGREEVLVLPDRPDEAAARLRGALANAVGLQPNDLAVVVTDTAGRPWRVGQVDFALGSAGLRVLDDLRGSVDADGRPLGVTVRAIADEVAAAADLVKGKQGRVPVAIVRGLAGWVGAEAVEGGAARLVRTGPGDWFALGLVEAVRASLGVEPGSEDSQGIGILPLHEETVHERVARAERLAAFGEDVGEVVLSRDASTVHLGEVGGWAAGRFAARLEAALWAEGLDPRSVEVVRGS
jgi:coenzyme F420-0:L-glutamate ligase/coenzyme F420-1:gamma-L-glutamate ligase